MTPSTILCLCLILVACVSFTQGVYVYTTMYTDDSCSTSSASLLKRNATCTPNPRCSRIPDSSFYGYVSCPSSIPSPLGTVSVVGYNDSTCSFTQEYSYSVNIFSPIDICVPDYFTGNGSTGSMLLTTSTMARYSDNSCRTQTGTTFNFASGNCVMNGSGGLKFVANTPANTTGFLKYKTYTDSSCTQSAKMTIAKKSQICVPSGVGNCVEIPTTPFYGTSDCLATQPDISAGSVTMYAFLTSDCSVKSNANVALYAPMNVCVPSPFIAGQYVTMNCTNTVTYTDSNCQNVKGNLAFNSGDCITNGSGRLSFVCNNQTVVNHSSKMTFSIVAFLILLVSFLF